MNKHLLLAPTLVLVIQLMATAQTPTAQAAIQTAPTPSAIHPAKAVFTRWSLSLETGPAFPVGNFNDKNFSSASAGGARTGIGAELAATYRFCPSLGVTMSAGYQYNPSVATPIFDEVPGPANGPAEFARQDSWKIARLLTGVVYEQPLSKNKRLALELRALAGVVKTTVPGYTYVSSSIGTAEEAWKYSHLTPGFAYQADAGLTYAITKRIAVLIGMGYTGSRFTGRYTYALAEQNASPLETGKGSRTIALGTIQCRAGVEIGL